EVAVDDLAVHLEELGGDLAEARRGGDAEAGLHVRDDAGRRAADRGALRLDRLDRGRRRRLRGCLRGGGGRGRRGGGGGRRGVGGPTGCLGAGGGEGLAPGRAHRVGGGEGLLVHLVDPTSVGAEGGGGGERYCSYISSTSHGLAPSEGATE